MQTVRMHVTSFRVGRRFKLLFCENNTVDICIKVVCLTLPHNNFSSLSPLTDSSNVGYMYDELAATV